MLVPQAPQRDAKLAGGPEPLTVYSGSAPAELSLLSLHESGGYLFARYGVRA